MKTFKDFWNANEEGTKNAEMYALITSPIHIGYFLTIKSDYDLFSDEVKVIVTDNKMNIEEIDVRRLFKKFNKEFS